MIEQGFKLSDQTLTYDGLQAIISVPNSDNNYFQDRVQTVFDFKNDGGITFNSLKVIVDRTETESTTGRDTPVIFDCNNSRGFQVDYSGTTQFSGKQLEVLLQEQGGTFFAVDSGSTLNLAISSVYLQATSGSINDSSNLYFFSASGKMDLNISENLVGIIELDDLSKNSSVAGIRSVGRDSLINLNAYNLLFVNNSQVENSYGIHAMSKGTIVLGNNSNSVLLKGFNQGIAVDQSSSFSGTTSMLGILDSDTAIGVSYYATLNLTTNNLFIDNCVYAIDNYGNTTIQATSAHVVGALSNNEGNLNINFGANSYFKGLTFNYDYYSLGNINISLGHNSIWDVSYDKYSLNPHYGMNHISSLNLDSATINLASAENTDNFLKVDKLKGTGSFNLLINTDSSKSTEIHSGTDSEGVFNISVALAQGSFDQIGNDGILFATDQSGKVQYQPVSSITDAGLTLSTPELVSEDNSGFTEWYISRINNEEGPTPSAMLDGFQNNYLFWRTLTDSTKERFGQLRHGQSAGVWGRVTAGSLSQGDLTNDYQTYRLGADTSIQAGLSLGAMFEIHEGDLNTSNGKGDMQAITAAIYGLYVSPSGYYADAGFRFGVMDYEYKNTALLYDEYDYNAGAVGAWLEVGKEWAFANNYTLTPHLAVNFGRFGTEHFTSDNGLKAKVDSVNSVIFTIGTDVGYKTETFEVSTVADLMTEVAGSQDIRISHNEASLTRSADYSDTWMEFGLSASYRPTNETLLWVNGRRSAFADLDNDWRINAGIRWSFY